MNTITMKETVEKKRAELNRHWIKNNPKGLLEVYVPTKHIKDLTHAPTIVVGCKTARPTPKCITGFSIDNNGNKHRWPSSNLYRKKKFFSLESLVIYLNEINFSHTNSFIEMYRNTYG